MISSASLSLSSLSFCYPTFQSTQLPFQIVETRFWTVVTIQRPQNSSCTGTHCSSRFHSSLSSSPYPISSSPLPLFSHFSACNLFTHAVIGILVTTLLKNGYAFLCHKSAVQTTEIFLLIIRFPLLLCNLSSSLLLSLFSLFTLLGSKVCKNVNHK